MPIDSPAQGDRVPPEVAIARLDLRQISLLAMFEAVRGPERQAHEAEHVDAVAAAEATLAQYAVGTGHDVARVARLFFSFHYVFPNLGLVGPFYDGDAGPLRDAAWIAALDSITSGIDVRDEFRARVWDDVCDEARRARAMRCYATDRALYSAPASATPEVVERHRRRIDTLMTTAECVPALLATWAIERNPDRRDNLGTAHIRDKHGLLEQGCMAELMGMRPNTLAQTLKRFRCRLGEECRRLWNIDRTATDNDDPDL